MVYQHDCGLTEVDHANQQAWLDIYDLIINLHASVSDINDFANEFSKINKDNFGMTDISEDIYFLFRPALKIMQEANKNIREKYGVEEKTKSLPSGSSKVSK